jgi:hypothetical protein
MPVPPRDVGRVLWFLTPLRDERSQVRDPFPPNTQRQVALYEEMLRLFPRLSVDVQQAFIDLSRAALAVDLNER